MSYDKFELLAEDKIISIGRDCGEDLVITSRRRSTNRCGWIFFYNTREFAEGGDFTSSLTGNGPIFISDDGDVEVLPSNSSGGW